MRFCYRYIPSSYTFKKEVREILLWFHSHFSHIIHESLLSSSFLMQSNLEGAYMPVCLCTSTDVDFTLLVGILHSNILPLSSDLHELKLLLRLTATFFLLQLYFSLKSGFVDQYQILCTAAAGFQTFRM